MKQTGQYHHGDLRASLLKEARELLVTQGIEGLSLRRLAERTGVSRMAPYHHFKDKHALLCAVAAAGFQQLDALMPRDDNTKAPADTMRHFIRAYIAFATEQPEQYDLMFGRHLWKQAEPTPELKQIAYATFRHYAERIRTLTDGAVSNREALRIAQASWATLHGLCRLLIDGIYIDAKDMQDVSDVALHSLLETLRLPESDAPA